MEWQWLKDWWRLKRWRKGKKEQSDDDICYCDDCLPDVRYYCIMVSLNFNYRTLGSYLYIIDYLCMVLCFDKHLL